MNIILFILEIIFMFIILCLSYKKFNIKGLISILIVLLILSNFLLYKETEFMGTTIGIDMILIATIFIINNIVMQKKGKEEVKKIIALIIIIISSSYLLLSLSQFLNISQININSNISYNNIFSICQREFLANNIALIMSLILNNKIYYLLRREHNMIWLSNIISIFFSQLLFSLLYTIILYIGKYGFIDIITMILLRTLLLNVISLIYTKIIYMTTKKEKL